MNGKQRRIAEVLYNLAENADNNCNFKHASVITQGSKILSQGINNGYRTKWGKHIKCCLHAEIAAINNLDKNYPQLKCSKSYNKLTIWVSCINNDKKTDKMFRESKPCIECITEIIKRGFKNVMFSNSSGNFSVCKPCLSTPESFYQTTAQKLYH